LFTHVPGQIVFQGSSILRAGIDAGAFEIGPEFCLTGDQFSSASRQRAALGQCDSCLVELDTGEAVLGCMTPIPEGRDKMSITVVASDEAWGAMVVGDDDAGDELEFV